jgi:hypothetical protein
MLQSSPLHLGKHSQNPSPKHRPWRLQEVIIEHSAVHSPLYVFLTHGSGGTKMLQSCPLHSGKHLQDPLPKHRPWRLQVVNIEHWAEQPFAYMFVTQGSALGIRV